MKQIKKKQSIIKKSIQESLKIYNEDVKYVSINYNNNVVVIEIIHNDYIDKEDIEWIKEK